MGVWLLRLIWGSAFPQSSGFLAGAAGRLKLWMSPYTYLPGVQAPPTAVFVAGSGFQVVQRDLGFCALLAEPLGAGFVFLPVFDLVAAGPGFGIPADGGFAAGSAGLYVWVVGSSSPRVNQLISLWPLFLNRS